MSILTSIPLGAKFTFAPAELLNASGRDARLPIDANGYVPLRRFDMEFNDRAIAVFEWLGEGAVRMSLRANDPEQTPIPLGFAAPIKQYAVFGNLQRDSEEIIYSQQVDSVTLTSPADDPYNWSAKLESEVLPDEYSRRLFTYGISLFADHLATRLWGNVRKTSSQPQTPAIPTQRLGQ